VALAREYGFTEPYLVIGNSGSAGSLAYYLAGQYDSIRNIWTNILTSKQFIWILRFWNICNVDWLIDSVFKKIDPLDTTRLENSKTRFLVSVFSMDDGTIWFLDRHEADIFELLRATKAMPIIFNHDVKIKDRRYRDASRCMSVHGSIEQAFFLGADKVIVINNEFGRSSILFALYALLLPATMRTLIAEEKEREAKGYPSLTERSRDIIWMCPQTLPISLLGNSSTKLMKSFALGYRDAKENLEFKTLLRQK
jgi:predicted patatin/cPLA2 family phospholipase